LGPGVVSSQSTLSQSGQDYLTDQTAASDDDTGVVGFGGWDD
jgi:hypothetical protein